jgi:hypothetical protein
MRASSFHLRAYINEVEHLASMDRHQIGTPLPSGSAAPPPSPRATVPDRIREWGSAGIVDPHESIVRDAGNGCDIGIPNSLLQNSATGGGHASMGGGFLGACVGEHNGNQNTSKNNEEAPQGVELDAAETLHGASVRWPGITRHSRVQATPYSTSAQTNCRTAIRR